MVTFAALGVIARVVFQVFVRVIIAVDMTAMVPARCPNKQSMNIVIDSIQSQDWEFVRAIYLEGISTGHATFETEAPDWERWDAGHLPQCRLVARYGDGVLGWPR